MEGRSAGQQHTKCLPRVKTHLSTFFHCTSHTAGGPAAAPGRFQHCQQPWQYHPPPPSQISGSGTPYPTARGKRASPLVPSQERVPLLKTTFATHIRQWSKCYWMFVTVCSRPLTEAHSGGETFAATTADHYYICNGTSQRA
jgi:hypothetical protein